ncbi:hypothetical protein J437_LFUL002761 [Ladona fulva]|uniref:Uncharacterized protein n=1 Tax=Ladona fulva TaxID=123851 RepID=A0A8K0JUX5_LADFU|nr:hypothetical protein J437_LFUL002761 [Ladona fulva]
MRFRRVVRRRKETGGRLAPKLINRKPNYDNGDFTDPRSHMNLGAMLHVNGKYREAETAYREALRLRPGDETTLTNLRRLYSLLARLQARANCTTEAQKRPKEEPASEDRTRSSKPEESKGDWSAAAATAVPTTGQ